MPGTSLNPKKKIVHAKAFKVLIADDHDIFRHGLKTLLNKYSFIHFAGEATNGVDLKSLVDEIQPEIVFMDIHMPGGSGIDATKDLLQKYPNLKIVVLSSYDDAVMVERMIKMGVSGYLTKSITLSLLDTLFDKILKNEIFISPDAANNVMLKKVSVGSSPVLAEHTEWLNEEITPREKEILLLVARGMSCKQMSDVLEIGVRTVETHKEKLMRKLGAKNTAELIAVAYEFKLVK